MEPLTWVTVAQLVARYGVPFVTGLFQKIENKDPVTAAEWGTLSAKIETPFDTLVPKA